MPNYRISGRVISCWLKHRIHAVSATKHYPLGTMLEDEAGNKYRYCKAGGTLLPNRGSWGYNAQISGHLAVPTTSPIGSKVIYGTVTSGDGIAADGAIAEDYLVDGYVTIWHADASTLTFRIIANTAVAVGGGTIALTLDDILPAACTAATETIEIMASPYIDMRSGNSSGLRPFMGVPMGPATATLCYHWQKVRGPIFIDPQAAVGTALKSQCVFRHDGSIDVQDDSDEYAQHMQHAGFVLTWAAAGTQGAPFIMLQIE